MGTSVVVALGLWSTGLIVVVHWGWLLQGMWDLPGSGIELLFPALTGGFLTTEPLEKPWCGFEETLCRFVLSWRHLLNVMYVHLPNSEPSLEGRQRAEL